MVYLGWKFAGSPWPLNDDLRDLAQLVEDIEEEESWRIRVEAVIQEEVFSGGAGSVCFSRSLLETGF